MADGATIDPRTTHLIFAGYRAYGFAPGTFISIAYNVDAFTSVVGVDGEGSWFANGDNSAVITATFMQSSQYNDQLSALFLADRNLPGGVLSPLAFVEHNGLTVYATPRARILSLPTATWADGVESREWRIGTTNLQGFVGGVRSS